MGILFDRLSQGRGALEDGLRLNGTLRTIESVNSSKDSEESGQMEG